VVEANREGLLESAKDVSAGGVAITLAKMSAVSGLGVVAGIRLNDKREIFSETPSRAILEVGSKENLEAVIEMADKLGLKHDIIGKVGGDEFKLNGVSMNMDKLTDIYFNRFKSVVEADYSI